MYRGECGPKRKPIEVDLQRGVLIAAEFLLGAADLVDDLIEGADPCRARPGQVRGARLAELGDHLVVAGIVLRGAAVEPVGGCLDQRMEIVVEKRKCKASGPAAIGVAEHVKGQHYLAVSGMTGGLP